VCELAAGTNPQSWLGSTPAEEIARMLEVLEARPVDLLICDHYSLGREWQRAMRPFTRAIMAVDDFAGRDHDCDLLLDQNAVDESLAGRYRKLVPTRARLLLGPHYALLRPEFLSGPRAVAGAGGAIRRVLIFFGGFDATNETQKALEALEMLGERRPAVDVIAPADGPHAFQVSKKCAGMQNVGW